MGVPKIGVPQNGWFLVENPIKMDDLGVPLFLETPMCFGRGETASNHGTAFASFRSLPRAISIKQGVWESFWGIERCSVDPDIMALVMCPNVWVVVLVKQISELTLLHEMKLPAGKQKSKVFVLTTRPSNAGPVGLDHPPPERVKSCGHRMKESTDQSESKGSSNSCPVRI